MEDTLKIGSRATKAKAKHSHCRWCGKKLPIGSHVRRKDCNKAHTAKYRMFVIKVLTPPDEWRRCALGSCGEWFPIWHILGKGHANRVCCCMKHSAQFTASKRRDALVGKTKNQKHTPKSVIDRRKQCFRKEAFGDLQCRRYKLCKFIVCSGFED